jgi:hypothetical protein
MNEKEAQLYLKALQALTIERLLQIKARNPEFFLKLEKKYLPRQLYMIMCGELCGNHCQSVVESFNAMLRAKHVRKAEHLIGKLSLNITCM